MPDFVFVTSLFVSVSTRQDICTFPLNPENANWYAFDSCLELGISVLILFSVPV